jgi:16S rRNA (adenine1518-N6/adenine1519-N6)-dimethyltransferase
VFLVQREVADRIVAEEGGKEYGALSVNMRVAMDVAVIARVPPGAFTPRPTVDSAIVRLTPRASPLVADADLTAFRAFVQSVFGMRRKQMQRVLRSLGAGSAAAADAMLASIGASSSDRAETLTPERFALLFRAWRSLPTEVPY